MLRGPAGPSGRDGLDGAPGLDGVPGIDGRNGRDGSNGRDGVDGKEGAQGERGPIGPAGPAGEMGRRGKQGLPGKQGPAGPAGICAYKANVDCGALAAQPNTNNNNNNNNSQLYEALLMPPTMIGQQQKHTNQNDVANWLNLDDVRQVSVNEGDTVQLSCQATGLPAPTYSWSRGRSTANNSAEPMEPICLDIASQLKVNSFPGGQLPLAQVDRSQAGAYECIADNGIPPAAVKRIELDVNFVPTIRLLPSPAVTRVELNSNIQLECLVESNPSAFTIWTFNGEPLMSSSSATNQLKERDASNGIVYDENNTQESLFKRQGYTITESTGQLGESGAHYSHLTLSLENIQAHQLGHYQCQSKNLLGQNVGHFLLLKANSIDEDEDKELSIELRRLRDLILAKTIPDWPLEARAGWPVNLAGKCGNCTTFGNEYRAKKHTINKQYQLELANQQQHHMNQQFTGLVTPSDLFKRFNDTALSPPFVKGNESIDNSSPKNTNPDLDINNNLETYSEETCKMEFSKTIDKTLILQQDSRYLDQFGKYVLHGSGSRFAIDWWSMDLGLHEKRAGYFVSSLHHPNELFEFEKLNDFVKLDNDGALKSASSQLHQLKWTMFQSSKLIYNGIFIYISSNQINQINDNHEAEQANTLQELQLVMHDLATNRSNSIPLAELISTQSLPNSLATLLSEPVDLGPEYKLSRIELAADELGILLIIPSITQSGTSKKSQPIQLRKLSPPMETTRRLKVVRLNLVDQHTATTDNTNNRAIRVQYLVSRKLDWRMIGQLFAIDGVLYGIRDRHSYQSKLLFAFDLVKCKFLSAEYVNEQQHLFTNHFGNTQMILYQPNEPPRLQILDAANILECPLKLMSKQANASDNPVS